MVRLEKVADDFAAFRYGMKINCINTCNYYDKWKSLNTHMPLQDYMKWKRAEREAANAHR